MLRVGNGPGNPARGFTYIEVLAAATVLAVLATAVIPLATWDAKRRKEKELRVSLRMIRDAIDQYNGYMAAGLILPTDVEQCALPAEKRTCFPRELDELIDGVEVGDPDSPEAEIVRFLYRMPIDPMTGEAEWGVRSYQDAPDARNWGGENVYDVFSLSPDQALDGSWYEDW